MKKIVEDTEDGLESLLGDTVTFFCANYFYTGKLIGVNSACVKLQDAKIYMKLAPGVMINGPTAKTSAETSMCSWRL